MVTTKKLKKVLIQAWGGGWGVWWWGCNVTIRHYMRIDLHRKCLFFFKLRMIKQEERPCEEDERSPFSSRHLIVAHFNV